MRGEKEKMQITIEESREFEHAKRDYLTKKLIVEDMRKQLKNLNDPVNKAQFENKISVDKWAEIVTDNEFKLGYPKARNEEIEAFRSLIKLAGQLMQKRAGPKKWEKIKDVFNPRNLLTQELREKMLDLTLRWNPLT